MPYFKASVQYDDWHGTVAADNKDAHAISVWNYLEKKGLVKKGEILIAVELFVGESHNNQLAEPYIQALLMDGPDNHEDLRKRLEKLEAAREPVAVREVRIDMPLEDFFAMFKRFKVVLTTKNLPLAELEYQGTE